MKDWSPEDIITVNAQNNSLKILKVKTDGAERKTHQPSKADVHGEFNAPLSETDITSRQVYRRSEQQNEPTGPNWLFLEHTSKQ